MLTQDALPCQESRHVLAGHSFIVPSPFGIHWSTRPPVCARRRWLAIPAAVLPHKHHVCSPPCLFPNGLLVLPLPKSSECVHEQTVTLYVGMSYDLRVPVNQDPSCQAIVTYMVLQVIAALNQLCEGLRVCFPNRSSCPYKGV